MLRLCTLLPPRLVGVSLASSPLRGLLRHALAWRWGLARWRLSVYALLLLCTGPAMAEQLLPVPELSARVIDQTQTLSASEQAGLEQRLAEFEQQVGSQLVILMVASTAPEDIAAYAHRVASQWKIGRADVGDGLLLLVAKDDRATRIEVARALEGAVPDLSASRIIDHAMLPEFRQNHYAGGLNAALDQLFALLRGEQLPQPKHSREPNASRLQTSSTGDLPGLAFTALVAVKFLDTILVSMLGRKLSLLAAGLLGGLIVLFLGSGWLFSALAVVVSVVLTLLSRKVPLAFGSSGGGVSRGGGGYRSGGGGFSSGGGGFRSGGGGSFGGGGASGRW